jgi:arsenate reductase (thioredoxin)
MDTVLFACVHNAGRSQMARAWFDRLADASVARGLSAGTEPAERVHQVVVEAMRERGFDLQNERPQKLTAELASSATLLVTMGCGESCPYVTGVPVIDWPLQDPKGNDLPAVRDIRDEVEKRVRDLVRERGWERK